MTVGIVVVSHSAALADGVVELAGQMAPGVRLCPAGGLPNGQLGTSLDLITAAITEADSGEGAVICYDLGSALLTAELALETYPAAQARRLQICHAPIVDAAIAAAVCASGGGAVADCAVAATTTAQTDTDGVAAQTQAQTAQAQVVLRNRLGLHARPAAQLAHLSESFAAQLTIARPGGQPVGLRSVLAVVAGAFRGGDEVVITGHGPDAQAAVAAAVSVIANGFGGDPELAARPPVAACHVDGILRASAAADGLAIGRLRRLAGLPGQLSPAQAQRTGDIAASIRAAAHKLSLRGEFGVAQAAIISDPDLLVRVGADGSAQAWWQAICDVADSFTASGDDHIAARAADVREAGAQVLGELGVHIGAIPAELSRLVILADELGPGEVAQLAEAGAAGLLLTGGSISSHATIVARGLGLPVVLGAGAAADRLADGQLVVLDGRAGTVVLDPDPVTLAAARDRQEAESAAAQQLRQAATEPVITASGRPVLIGANVASLADARAAVRNGADTIGLLRTELLAGATDLTEEAHYGQLSQILGVFGDRPVTVRVLDTGGDKPGASTDFLGQRGIRHLLAEPGLLHAQLRAILRAAAHRPVGVMAPMVTIPAEAAAFRAAVHRAVTSLCADGLAHREPAGIGIMVEVPAAALAISSFAGLADFLSIGSNDLLGYLMATNRTDPHLAHLLDPTSLALWRLLQQLAADAEAAGIPLAVCGEMAGMDSCAAGLVDLGVAELSMAPTRIPAIKHLLRRSPGDKEH